MARRSLAEFFQTFDLHARGIAYAQPLGYRMDRWSYARIAETAARVARELESRGVAPGNRVMLWGPNSAQWAAAFWGCILRGAVVVPMDYAATPDFASRVAEQVSAKLLFAGRDTQA
ncbi:MAG: AMP-binding protein, partial [Bryobacteraceae bacterium]